MSSILSHGCNLVNLNRVYRITRTSRILNHQRIFLALQRGFVDFKKNTQETSEWKTRFLQLTNASHYIASPTALNYNRIATNAYNAFLLYVSEKEESNRLFLPHQLQDFVLPIFLWMFFFDKNIEHFYDMRPRLIWCAYMMRHFPHRVMQWTDEIVSMVYLITRLKLEDVNLDQKEVREEELECYDNLIRLLRLSGVPEAYYALQLLSKDKRVPHQISNQALSLVEQADKAEDVFLEWYNILTTATIDQVSIQLDVLWALFYATGSKNMIIEVMKTLKKTSDIKNDLIYEARMKNTVTSLYSNCMQHKLVLLTCKEQLESKTPQYSLLSVLKKEPSKTEDNEGINKPLISAILEKVEKDQQANIEANRPENFHEKVYKLVVQQPEFSLVQTWKENYKKIANAQAAAVKERIMNENNEFITEDEEKEKSLNMELFLKEAEKITLEAGEWPMRNVKEERKQELTSRVRMMISLIHLFRVSFEQYPQTCLAAAKLFMVAHNLDMADALIVLPTTAQRLEEEQQNSTPETDNIKNNQEESVYKLYPLKETRHLSNLVSTYWFQKALDHSPRNAEALYWFGFSLVHLFSPIAFAPALAALQKAIHLGYLKASIPLALLFVHNDKVTEAIELIIKYLDAHPKDPKAIGLLRLLRLAKEGNKPPKLPQRI